MDIVYRIAVGIKKFFAAFEKDVSHCNASFSLSDNFTVTAHAGAMHTRANTVCALREAALSGAQVLELDLSFRPDGTAVMRHNVPKSNRTGVPFEKALAAIAQYPDVRLNLDLKSSANLPGAVRLLEKYSMKDRVFFTGIHGDFIEVVQRECPGIPYWLNHWSTGSFGFTAEEIAQKVQEVKNVGAIGINMNSGNLSRELCTAMHEAGLLVSVWTINSRADMYSILSLSPDNITTKRPLRLINILKGKC